MAGPSTSGRYSPEELLLPRGILYFSFLHPTTERPLGFRDIGNAPSFSISYEVETLDHTSSREGLSFVDKQVILSRTANIACALENFNHENLALFHSGRKLTPTNSAVAGFSNFVAYSNVTLGLWYDISSNTGVRAYGIDPNNLTVMGGPLGTVPLSEGVDYIVDTEFGRIQLVATSSTVANGDSLGIALTPDSYAPASINQVTLMTENQVLVALRFVSDNPAANTNAREAYFLPKVNLTADGDLNLIGDDWASMPLTGVAQRSEIAYPNAPFGWIEQVPTAA